MGSDYIMRPTNFPNPLECGTGQNLIQSLFCGMRGPSEREDYAVVNNRETISNFNYLRNDPRF